MSGVIDDRHVRIFSEGSRTNEMLQQAQARHDTGGESDSASRNLARFMQGVGKAYMIEFSVKPVYRPDRFGRGGDHREVLNQGFPAVRITEAAENYTRQHQNVRVENGIHYVHLKVSPRPPSRCYPFDPQGAGVLRRQPGGQWPARFVRGR
jgi:hypothetical protein